MGIEIYINTYFTSYISFGLAFRSPQCAFVYNERYTSNTAACIYSMHFGNRITLRELLTRFLLTRIHQRQSWDPYTRYLTSYTSLRYIVLLRSNIFLLVECFGRILVQLVELTVYNRSITVCMSYVRLSLSMCVCVCVCLLTRVAQI